MHGKKSSLVTLICISFSAKNNCIFFENICFLEILCKRTVFHILENPWKLLEYLFLKRNKNCCFKSSNLFKTIAISRLEKICAIVFFSYQNLLAMGLPYLILNKIGCLCVCKSILLYLFLVWAFIRVVPNTTARCW